MKPLAHILLGFLFAIVLYFVFPHVGIIEASIIFFSSFLIDVDHYLYHMYKEKKISFRKVFLCLIDRHNRIKELSNEEKRDYYMGVYFFHGLEILVLLFVLGHFISNLFFYLFIGFAFHLLLDVFYHLKLGIPIYKISIIRDFYKFKKLKRFK